MIRYFNRRGDPISQGEWVQAMADDEVRRVANTQLPGGCFISTVWLGLDHSHGKGPPLFFETMAFDEDSKESDVERYASERDAIAGHAQMVAKWSAKR